MVRIGQRGSGNKINPVNVLLAITVLFTGLLLLLSWGVHNSNSTTNSDRFVTKSGDIIIGQRPDQRTFNPAFRLLGFNVDELWKNILKFHPNKSDTEKKVVIEVGCFRIQQSLYAAQKGYKVISVEASPKNYGVMVREHEKLSPEVQRRITIKHNAASDVSGKSLMFDGVGGTGDHVAGMNLDAAQKRKYEGNEKVAVKSLALDDLISSLPPDEFVHLLKIDTQGHEAFVFKGLRNSVSEGKIRFIMFEYWVDAMDQSAGKPVGTCSSVPDVLVPLVDAGYVLFDLSVSMHPKTDPKPSNEDSFYRPLDFWNNCRWYAEKGFAAKNYGMGYWTDVLAVYGGEFSEAEIAYGSSRSR